MAEPTCAATITPTEATPNGTLFIPGVTGVPHSFVDKPELNVKALPHSRVWELRELGYTVKVTGGDDPLKLAKAEGNAAAEPSEGGIPGEVVEPSRGELDPTTDAENGETLPPGTPIEVTAGGLSGHPETGVLIAGDETAVVTPITTPAKTNRKKSDSSKEQ